MQPKFLFATESKYKKALISRLRMDIEFKASNIDESPQKNEQPQSLVKRLSEEKAMALATANQDKWVIGSDQIALHQNRILGKPGDQVKAISQLSSFSGKSIKFITGIALVNFGNSITLYDESVVEVKFRELSQQQIKNYLELDEPYDCAGSFKVESLGIALFDWVKSDDPTSLEGLPLITLCRLLRQAGIEPLEYSK